MYLKNFKTLETSKFTDVKSINYLNEDAGKLLFLDSPASEIFKDYKKTSPLVTTEDTTIPDVKKKMRLANKDIILVINNHNEVIGIIDLHYAESVELQKLAQNSGTNIKDMTAKDAMLNITKVRMISYDIIKDAKIGHIVNTLLDDNRHQVLVYDQDEKGNTYIRGYFALSYIKRKLNLDVHLSHQKDSVAGISQSIK